jgi:hypothetical protein
MPAAFPKHPWTEMLRSASCAQVQGVRNQLLGRELLDVHHAYRLFLSPHVADLMM